MRNDELIERYLYAVTKRLPAATRQDVARELRSLIADMLETRCGELPPTEKDVRVVLTELGTPSALAAQYRPDRKTYLIGPEYYTQYLLILKIVLLSVAFGMAVSGVVTTVLDSGAVWYAAVLQWLGMALFGCAMAFTFVTLLFTGLERRGVPVQLGEDNLSDLPPVPQKKERISKGEAIFGIVVSVVFVVVFLAAPQSFGMLTGEGEMIPIFRPEIVRQTWYVVVLFAALGIVRDSVKLLDGRYTRRVMIVTLCADAGSALLSVYWLLGVGLVNPAFVTSVTALFDGEATFIGTLFAHFHQLFLGVLLLALVLDGATTVYRTLRAGR